ncbi:SusD/RagB family nutrient-binding outer membrane lipoprotein [Maribellus sp. YY47]|uniref:SusD/RagB family nutrient-binding outer membrane lipoprotein n=1 Tax=Maribellus sp. YY47 TaxID=2929486 RepID=UPI0020005D7C|nr:SusD/RagB family nutrient-binding outer membrane lipoprotein [Maribellus sp. YY47]MCK3684072.1 SusD/RagB family nutrient-binding outer membrane lipoprotein [Maribellus sp. YY47]
MKKIFFAIIFTLGFLACTDNFEEANRNQFQISDKELEQDFNLLGSPFQNMLYNLFGGQIDEDLSHDNWVRHVGCPTPFVGGANNTTYYITWNSSNNNWNRIYNNIMSPGAQVIKMANEGGYEVFSAWAKLVQAYAISKLTSFHGPVIYSNYGIKGQSNIYDSEPELYDNLFATLDEVQAVFAANKDYTGLKKFDASYNGDINKWLKFINSLRLRLAIRISKTAPDLAKAQGEKAMSDAAGLILTESDNFNVALYGNKLYLAVICFEWGDTRMSAAMESFLVGLKDPRIEKYFEPATDNTLYPDHPAYPYKGIHSGAYLEAKDQRLTYSTVSESFKSVTSRISFSCAEVYFAKAEAALRGWDGAGDAQENYENGVKASFAHWGAGGVDAYLADATSTPINYVDPKDSRNNWTSRSNITVAWNAADSNERKLEKIITQKWINDFTNANEPWCDHRRTGYPKLPYNTKNDSNSDWGVIPANEFLKRQVFAIGERDNNPTGVAAAVATMGTGAKDDIATRLWWDTGGANF